MMNKTLCCFNPGTTLYKLSFESLSDIMSENNYEALTDSLQFVKDVITSWEKDLQETGYTPASYGDSLKDLTSFYSNEPKRGDRVSVFFERKGDKEAFSVSCICIAKD